MDLAPDQVTSIPRGDAVEDKDVLERHSGVIGGRRFGLLAGIATAFFSIFLHCMHDPWLWNLSEVIFTLKAVGWTFFLSNNLSLFLLKSIECANGRRVEKIRRHVRSTR